MAVYKKVANCSKLLEGQITAVNVDNDKIALYRVNGQVFATFDTCTHDECSLEDFGKIEGDEVECTCHGARFKITTGEVTRPPATIPLQIYRVKIEGEDIYVEI
jgi:nitrite reductase/ring-hydroxylating ferredoxin subunit